MRSVNFSHIAASCRQAYNGVRRPVAVLESCFNLAPGEIPRMIQFFYEDYDPYHIKRLRDEDLREIFYLLTDLYPDEIDPDPDLVNMLSQLSDVSETTTSLYFVMNNINKILESESNDTRATIMRVILKRMTARDAYYFVLRLMRRSNPFKRSHILLALAYHTGIPSSRLKRASHFTPLSQMAQMIKKDGDEVDLPLTPVPGDALLLPMPSRYEEMFLSSTLEVLRGQRLSLHKMEDMLLLMDPNGVEAVLDSGDELDLIGSADIPDGIYLVEYVPTDSFPITIVDVRYTTDGVHDKPFHERRCWLMENIPELFVKLMIPVSNEKQMKHNLPDKSMGFLWNNQSYVDYENKKQTIVRYTTKSKGEIFRLVGGVWQLNDDQQLKLSGWRVAARDGIDGYYEVGTIQCEPIIEKKLRTMLEESKALEGEMALTKSPCFVGVEIHWTEYDNTGIHIQGVITQIVSDAGRSDVIAVEDVEYE